MQKFSTPLLIVVAIAVVVGAFFTGFYLRPQYDKRQLSGSTDTAKEFVSQITKGDNTAAYALTAKALQEKQDQSAFNDALGDLKSDNAELQSPQALKRGDTILYYQQVNNLPKSDKGSTTGMFYITLVKEDGKWKVSSLSVQ